MEKFQNDFNAAGGRQFGSGWVFVTVAKDGKLAIETRPNQDNPIMDGKRALMGNDVWEHAYYLNYQNRRARLFEGVVEYGELEHPCALSPRVPVGSENETEAALEPHFQLTDLRPLP